jgi:hypothetical protein
VPKSDGGIYLYNNYRGLKLIMKKNWNLLPLIGEAPNWLLDAQYITIYDIGNAYYCMHFKECNKRKTTF